MAYLQRLFVPRWWFPKESNKNLKNYEIYPSFLGLQPKASLSQFTSTWIKKREKFVAKLTNANFSFGLHCSNTWNRLMKPSLDVMHNIWEGSGARYKGSGQAWGTWRTMHSLNKACNGTWRGMSHLKLLLLSTHEQDWLKHQGALQPSSGRVSSREEARSEGKLSTKQ